MSCLCLTRSPKQKDIQFAYDKKNKQMKALYLEAGTKHCVYSEFPNPNVNSIRFFGYLKMCA